MNKANTCLFFACLLVLSATLNINPWVLDVTVSGCNRHFQVDSDYQYALCVNNGGTHVYKWSSSAQNFVHSQTLFTSNSLHQVSLTSDGLFIATLRNSYNGPLQIFTREDNGIFSKVDTITASYTNFHLTDNHLYLTYETLSNSRVNYAEWNPTTKNYDIKNYLTCYDCDSSVSEDGEVVLTSKYSHNLTIFKKNAGGSFQQVATGFYGMRLRSMVANIQDSSEFYIACMNYYSRENLILKYSGGSSIETIASFKLANSSNYQMFGDRTAMSPDNRWFAYIAKVYSFDGYSLVQLPQEDPHDIIHNDTHWQSLSGALDISFQQLKSGKMAHTITSSSAGTAIYLIDSATDCSLESHATGQILYPTGCVCQTGYFWNTTSDNCEQIDCTKDTSSTGVKLDNGECQCLTYHFWDPEISECRPHCNRNLAESKDPLNHKVCLCRNTATWDDVKKECVLDCLAISYSTGQHQWYEVCECKQGSTWNSDGLTCDLKCSHISGSTGYNVVDNSCTCNDGLEWVPESLTCG